MKIVNEIDPHNPKKIKLLDTFRNNEACVIIIWCIFYVFIENSKKDSQINQGSLNNLFS